MTLPFADHFSSLAPAYAAARPAYPDALLDYLAGVAPARSMAWDCGAGSGQATAGLATRFHRVLATDASREQLAQAPALPNVTYRVALADHSGLPDASADLVAVAQALHWFDLEPFFAEVRRVLVPSGVVAVWCYGLQSVGEPAIDAALRRFYSESVGPYWPPERRWVEVGYRGLPFPFDELEPRPFEMAVEWSLDALLAYVRTWSAVARYAEVHRRDPVEALGAALLPLWGGGARSERRRVHWPIALRVGRVGAR